MIIDPYTLNPIRHERHCPSEAEIVGRFIKELLQKGGSINIVTQPAPPNGAQPKHLVTSEPTNEPRMPGPSTAEPLSNDERSNVASSSPDQAVSTVGVASLAEEVSISG
jgi:hypothetical protein